jgi:hypothetical protein
MDPEAVRRRTRADDEAAADVARDALRSAGAIPIEPDPPVAVLLGPGERVLAVRHARGVALLARAGSDVASQACELYLTNRRLVVESPPFEVLLDDIREVGVLDDEVLLLVDRAGGVRIRTDNPRVLRVEIAAARSARRAGALGGSAGQSPSR